MATNTLTTYSFLAALFENNADLYNRVYVPIVQRALSLYAKTGKRKGFNTDIQDVIREKFGLEIPIQLVTELIRTSVNRLSRKKQERFNFEIFKDGQSFQFSDYSFYDTEELYEQEKRHANALQEGFELYLKAENAYTESCSFSDFIDQYKNRLSAFFKKQQRLGLGEADASYIRHVNYLYYIEANNHELYKVAERIYIGSLIASYLESGVKLEAKYSERVIYYLDTRLVLALLDLQTEIETAPIKELVNLINQSGGEVRILNITLDEISGNIQKAIETYSKEHPTTTINEACVRLGNNKLWLNSLVSKLQNVIEKDYHIQVDPVSQTSIKEAEESKDLSALEALRKIKKSAKHDVIAYYFIREKRIEPVTLFQKAKYWFVTSNVQVCDFNATFHQDNQVQETVLPNELTSFLFFKNPTHNLKTVSHTGLRELIAQTLADEYPSKDIINEFDNCIQTYTEVSDDEYDTLISSIAHYSTKQVEKLIQEASRDSHVFNTSIHKIIDDGRKKRDADQKEFIQTKQDNKSLSRQLQDLTDKYIRLENKVNSLVQLKRKIRHWGIVTIIAIVLFISAAYLKDTLRDIIRWIASVGGLWGFISCAINIIKLFK